MRRSRFALLMTIPLGLLLIWTSSELAGQDKKSKKKSTTAQAAPAKPQSATPAQQLKIARDFKVELLYSVPKESQGSWVNLCVDPKGRLITSDQNGPLYRITPPPIGGPAGETKVEKIKAEIGEAQGMCWAFDALYVVVNAPRRAGLYRVTDSDGDDMPDKVELLRAFEGGGGEHGPHAVIPNPDGKRLTIVCGNQTKLVKYDTTKVPPHWGEDHLLPRLPDGNGFMRGVMGPGGAIYNVNPDGKNWELFSVGYRNQFDASYNLAGDLFTYDADMEWDMNTPWYRPTRICLATAGSEFGWRNGAGKYPHYYPDNLPGIDNIGPGSPTGTCFGYGAKFPAKYQNAYFICDWSYGKMYAVHLENQGSTYTATHEEFFTGTPLALTDVVINPKDGAMYVTVGGRKTQSGLYRVTYTGSESTAPVSPPAKSEALKQRQELETNISVRDPSRVASLLKLLSSNDRTLRFTARASLEQQDPKVWADQALTLSDPLARANALLALTRVSAPCPQHAKPESAKPNADLGAKILKALNEIRFEELSSDQRLEVLRVYHVLFNRFGPPAAEAQKALLARFEPLFPAANRWVNAELGQLLVYLESPAIAAKLVHQMREAPTQEEQMEYMRSLRVVKSGWTPELRKDYFNMFVKAASFRGGNSLRGFMRLMREDAWANVPEAERMALRPIIDSIPAGVVVDTGPSRPFHKKWTINELSAKLDDGLKQGRNFDRGRKLFAEARCFGCHRFDSDGSSYGPDLSAVSGRFSTRDLLESILDPNKEISDQYAAVEIETLSGKKVIGRIVNLHGDVLHINTNMLDPNKMENVNVTDIETRKVSKVSMMPEGLLDVLKEDEILDLMAYLLSRGDRNSPMFAK